MAPTFHLHMSTVTNRKRIAGAPLVSAIDAYLDVLRGLDQSTNKGRLRWYVTGVSLGSASIAIEPDLEQGTSVSLGNDTDDWSTAISEAFADGVRQLSEGNGSPAVFTPAVLKAIERLGNTTDEEITEIQAWSSAWPEKPVRITKQLANQASTLLNTARIAFGMIEGVVTTLTLSQGGHVSIRDASSGSLVQCPLTQVNVSEASAAFSKRVRVQGDIEYSSDWKPQQIVHVTNWWRHDADPTPIDELIGIFEDFTDGLPAEEFLNRRGDEHAE